jgi:hypothetical protein
MCLQKCDKEERSLCNISQDHIENFKGCGCKSLIRSSYPGRIREFIPDRIPAVLKVISLELFMHFRDALHC